MDTYQHPDCSQSHRRGLICSKNRFRTPSPSETKHNSSSESRHTVIVTMYVNSSGADSGSYSLTFLGKKVGRHHSVAPAGKQRAWETTNRSTCPEDPGVSLRPGRVPVAALMPENLPGSVPELEDERPCPIIHSTQFDPYEDRTAGVSGRKVAA